MAIKEIIENNVALWTLSLLLTGFLSGIATYHWGLSFTGSQIVSRGAVIVEDDQKAISIAEYNKLQQAYLKTEVLQNEIEPIKARENFYRTFLNYLVFKDRDSKNKKAFVDLVSNNYNASVSGNMAQQKVHIAVVKKGSDWISGTATLQGDPTSWPIPKEINEAVHSTMQ